MICGFALHGSSVVLTAVNDYQESRHSGGFNPKPNNTSSNYARIRVSNTKESL